MHILVWPIVALTAIGATINIMWQVYVMRQPHMDAPDFSLMWPYVTANLLLLIPLLSFSPLRSAVARAATRLAITLNTLGVLVAFFTVNPFIREVYGRSWHHVACSGIVFGLCLIGAVSWFCIRLIAAVHTSHDRGSLAILLLLLLHIVGFSSFIIAIKELRWVQIVERIEYPGAQQ